MKSSSKAVVIVATSVFVLSQAYLASLVHALRPNIVVLQLTFSPHRYWEILDEWGEAGRALYRGHFSADFIHIGVFSLFGYLIARHGGLFDPGERAAASRFAALLPVAGLFDLGENLLQLALLSGPVGADSVAIPLSALCSTVKWTLVGLFSWITARRVLKRLGLYSR
ncbi:MAG: hypothetical protein JNM92_03780 [Zoogloea sp.]|nr:hypothetical protein [Zoogloea sp.]